MRTVGIIGRKLMLGVGLFLSMNTLIAQKSVSLGVDSNRIEIGDPLRFFLKIETAKNEAVQFPVFSGDTLAHFEIISKEKIDTTQLNGKQILSQYFTASVYDSGTYTIPSVPIVFNDDTAFSESFEITATAPIVDTSQPIKPIKAPLKVPYQLADFYLWIGLGLLFILAIVAFFLYRKYRKNTIVEIARPKPVEPAHVWALAELTKLNNEKLWQKEEHKKYYSRLSEIMRSYLEYRYDVLALESTTDEIKLLIADKGIGNSYQTKLIETLILADFAKFAKMTPLPDQNTRCMEDAKAFVQHTKLIEKSQPNTPTKK